MHNLLKLMTPEIFLEFVVARSDFELKAIFIRYLIARWTLVAIHRKHILWISFFATTTLIGTHRNTTIQG